MKNLQLPEKLNENLYRICTPFDGVYTSVFILTSEQGTILIDSASYPEDITECIIPALKNSGITPDILLCSHFHCDHAGGLETVLDHYPDIAIGSFDATKSFKGHNTIHCTDGQIFYDRYQVLNLKGHMDECLAVLDLKTKTLITCDALQQYGVGHYNTTVTDRFAYFDTLDRVATLDIERIIGAHDFDPMGYDVVGKDKIRECLDVCRKCVKEIYNIE